MLDEITPSLDSPPTLHLPDGEMLHCGPENQLLRHVVQRLFDSFKINELRHEDSTWLPLVLYGESLCGKSLVAHGLANAWKQHYLEHSTYVVTAADLARTFQKTRMIDDVARLTRRLVHASLLVIDDVQLLAGKTTTEEWLANLLDQRARSQTPSIVTCSTNVASSELTPRLRSRLCVGLSVCISLPYAATRKDIILKSAQSFDLLLVEEDLDQLVELTSGKPISGIVSAVANVAHQHTISADSGVAEQTENLQALIQKLIRSTARRFGAKVTDVKGPSRRKNTVLARAVAMFLIRELTPLSLAEVGQLFRNRDHSTVRHACEKIKTQIVDDELMREAITSICRSLDVRMPSSWFDLVEGKCA